MNKSILLASLLAAAALTACSKKEPEAAPAAPAVTAPAPAASEAASAAASAVDAGASAAADAGASAASK